MTDDTLHKRLEKILRLAKDEAATEEERDAAMGRAQEIAFKYNIDLLLIDTDEETGGVERSDSRWAHEWEAFLLVACASVNFCRVGHFNTRDSSKRQRTFVYGKKHNIQATLDLFDYLHKQIVLIEVREVSRRDKRMQYARKVLIEVVKDLLPTQYMRRVLEDNEDAYLDAHGSAPFMRPREAGHRYVQTNNDALVEAAAIHLQGNDHMLKGTEGLRFIIDRTGLTASYASEIRPYLRRGEYAPEIVRNMGVWRRSFELGMVQRITNRLDEKYAELLDDAGDTGKALVVKEDAGLDDFDKDLPEAESNSKKLDHRGLRAGARAAEEISIDKYDSLTETKGRELNA
jgi:uncharacterized DUF497 family protein